VREVRAVAEQVERPDQRAASDERPDGGIRDARTSSGRKAGAGTALYYARMLTRGVRSLALLVSLALACASSGTRFNADLVPKIQPERSTEADVRKLFGQPTSTAVAGTGGARWRYFYEETTTRDTGSLTKIGRSIASIFGFGMFWPPVDIAWEKTTRHDLVVFFDSEGVVRDYTYERTEVPTRRVY
jgi:outer membrane protein assembly factor BamE (lipoprotein component of BamABCDE complex)